MYVYASTNKYIAKVLLVECLCIKKKWDLSNGVLMSICEEQSVVLATVSCWGISMWPLWPTTLLNVTQLQHCKCHLFTSGMQSVYIVWEKKSIFNKREDVYIMHFLKNSKSWGSCCSGCHLFPSSRVLYFHSNSFQY